jgi:hypothetical protein
MMSKPIDKAWSWCHTLFREESFFVWFFRRWGNDKVKIQPTLLNSKTDHSEEHF